ncbi:MAG TPA: glycosyltransferase family 39 protein [Vicinamibacterales bacterium]
MPRGTRGARGVLLALLAAGIAVYFVSLGNSAIWDANEAFYVETPREMLEAHDLVNPSFNYRPRFNKPVLSYWMVAGLYKLFGVSVAVQRVGIASGAMIIVACAYVLAGIGDRRSWTAGRGPGIRDPGSGIRDQGSRIRDQGLAIEDPRSGIHDRGLRIQPLAGLFASAGLAAAPRVVMFARRIFIDVWLTAFTSLTLTFFALSETRPERRRLYLTLMYVSAGFGVLTKGPVAILLPALAFGGYLAVTRQFRRVTEMMIPLGAVIIAVIVVPWYAALHHQHGWKYIESFFVSENIERFTEGVGVLQRRGPLFYLPVVFSDSFPWSIFLPAAAVAAWRRPARLETLLWCWIVAIVGFFSLSAGKQDLYIFPIVPAVAALGGLSIERGLADDRWRPWLTRTLAVSGVLFAVAGGIVLFLFDATGRVYTLRGAFAIAVAGLAGGVLVCGLALARRPAAAAMTLLAATIAANWIFVLRVLPDFERYKPVPFFSRTLESRLKPGDAVAEYQVALPSLVFYLKRHVDQYFDPDPFVSAMQAPRHVYATISAADYQTLAPRLAPHTCIVDHRPTFDVKLGRVLAREPLPELLLITNDCR